MSGKISPNLRKWLDGLELSGKAARTLAAYGDEISRLAAWCSPRDVETLTRDELEQYLLERKRKGLGASGSGRLRNTPRWRTWSKPAANRFYPRLVRL